MELEVDVSPGLHYAEVRRNEIPVARLNLDHFGQVREIMIEAVATPEETDEILRLAGAHVACYVVERKVGHIGGILQERMTGDVSLSRSSALLDFRAIPEASRAMSLFEIEQAMALLGVKIIRL